MGSAAVASVRDQATTGDAEVTRMQAMTPAADGSNGHAVVAPQPAPEGTWSGVPIQRPRHLREAPPVAPPPPLPIQTADRTWTPGEALLPTPEATEHWNPDDARMPEHGPNAIVARAYYNPDSAALPRPKLLPRVTWDPNDARLPTL